MKMAPDGWISGKFEDFIVLQRGYDLTKEQSREGCVPVISSSGVSYCHDTAKVEPPGVVTGRKGSLGKVWFIDVPFWPHDTTLWVKDFKGNDPEYIKVFLERLNLESFDAATSVPTLNRNNLLGIRVVFPPLPEQRKIAAILSTWDRAIELTEKLIAAKQKRKQALMQQLLDGKGWKKSKISTLVRRVDDPIIIDPKQLYREVGIRSHGKGIFHKEAVTGETIGDKRVYWVHPNCFVFNVVFAWEQAVAKTTRAEKGMIASHRFPMYEPIGGKIDLDYLLYFFKTLRGKHLLGLASPGGAGRNRTLSQTGFLNTSIPVPPVAEQHRMSAILMATDVELDLLDRRRSYLRTQKKGLMQQLLTGKVRVNVDTEMVQG